MSRRKLGIFDFRLEIGNKYITQSYTEEPQSYTENRLLRKPSPVRGVMLVEKSATEIESRRDDTPLEPVVPTGLYRFLSQFLPTSRPYGTEENSVKLAH